MATLTELKAVIDDLASNQGTLDGVITGTNGSPAYEAGVWLSNRLSPGGLSANQAQRFGELWSTKNLYGQFQNLGKQELWKAALTAQVFKDRWVQSYGLGAGAPPPDSALQHEYEEETLASLPDASQQWSPRGLTLPLLTEAALGNPIAFVMFRSLMDTFMSQPGATGTQIALCSSLREAAK